VFSITFIILFIYFPIIFLNFFIIFFSGRSPKALSIQKLRELGVCGADDSCLPNFSAHTITVPGYYNYYIFCIFVMFCEINYLSFRAPAAWCDVLSQWGSLDLATVLEPAIDIGWSFFLFFFFFLYAFLFFFFFSFFSLTKLQQNLGFQYPQKPQPGGKGKVNK
jgi:hypothetical protein